MTPADKQAMLAKQRSIDNAVEFLKKRLGKFPADHLHGVSTIEPVGPVPEWIGRTTALESPDTAAFNY